LLRCEYYLCIMYEPQTPHFVLADGTYCHILSDRLVIAKKEIPAVLPEPDGKKLWFEVIGMSFAALIMLFFCVTMILSGYFLLAFLTFALACFSAFAAYRMFGFTDTKAIIRDDILQIVYHRRKIGNDAFIVLYTDPQGKPARRRLNIYDSQECMVQALQVMDEEGLFGDGSMRRTAVQ
jgi:hypothetical protein